MFVLSDKIKIQWFDFIDKLESSIYSYFYYNNIIYHPSENKISSTTETEQFIKVADRIFADISINSEHTFSFLLLNRIISVEGKFENKEVKVKKMKEFLIWNSVHNPEILTWLFTPITKHLNNFVLIFKRKMK